MRRGPLRRPAWLETPYHGEPPGVRHRDPALLVFSQQPIGAKRDGHVVPVSNLHPEKRGRRDSDHWKGVAVEAQRAAERPGVPAKLALPERMAEYHPRVAAGLTVVLCAERPTQHGGDAEVAEEFSADIETLRMAGFSA